MEGIGDRRAGVGKVAWKRLPTLREPGDSASRGLVAELREPILHRLRVEYRGQQKEGVGLCTTN